MTRAEAGDLRRRAQNYLGREININGRTHTFIRINNAVGLREPGEEMNFKISGSLETPNGKIIERSLRTILSYFAD
jgi:hypothetical protein